MLNLGKEMREELLWQRLSKRLVKPLDSPKMLKVVRKTV
jgi:hypothetical protein